MKIDHVKIWELKGASGGVDAFGDKISSASNTAKWKLANVDPCRHSVDSGFYSCFRPRMDEAQK
eukprot:TRINITY_DN15346_c0_g1_i1.p1 TRINITY_DN15346_c0_g1~~TRINITY_DN15346_c0_g1_i1.p1  ORF type:complete len:64 (-),score=11.81 TRINITY_DN15346_c0_g1_i1:91-282(-)